MKNLILPFKRLTDKESRLSVLILVTLIAIIWLSSGSKYVPGPMEIASSLPRLVQDKDMIGNFAHSLFFCFECMFYSLIFSLIVCYMSVLPIFKTLCIFMRKFRFLPSAGLSFLFMKMTNSIDEQMTWMMVFGVTTWMIDGMVGVALSITQDDVNYAKSLRLSRWNMMKELLIFGKAAELMQVCISVFAISWMMLASIENIAKAEGGIGVILAESSKYFKFEEVYAIQLLILFTGIAIDYLLNRLKVILFPHTKPR